MCTRFILSTAQPNGEIGTPCAAIHISGKAYSTEMEEFKVIVTRPPLRANMLFVTIWSLLPSDVVARFEINVLTGRYHMQRFELRHGEVITVEAFVNP
jgi:hydroxyacyl-ACP dehydratase HTD2-like protein with hotdog domain